MRKEIYRMAPSEARDRLALARVAHVAGIGERGQPILRTLHPVVIDGDVFFHGAPAGEKQELVSGQVVVSIEEVVASVPSYFVDAERACPATTYYRSVQAHGRLEPVGDASLKGRVLQAFMEKFQREGGHVPIAHEHALYRRAIEGISILRVHVDRIDGKAKLGQNRTPAERAKILERLWTRGDPADAGAIEAVRMANPDTPTPRFLVPPASVSDPVTLHVDMFTHARGFSRFGPSRPEPSIPIEPPLWSQLCSLLRDAYWNVGVDDSVIETAHRHSDAWVGALDGRGGLAATARAVSDRSKHATIYDVMVRPDLRGSGLGTHVVALLLEHPEIRTARRVWLRTRTPAFYEWLGFVVSDTPTPPRNSSSVRPSVGESHGEGDNPDARAPRAQSIQMCLSREPRPRGD